jgi:hypothetical protein
MWFHWRVHNAIGQIGRSPSVESRGPAPPVTVAAAAQKAFKAMSETESAKLRFQEEHGEPEAAPVLPPDAAILERSETGTLQVPDWNDGFAGESEFYDDSNWNSDTDSCDRSSSFTDSSVSLNTQAINPERRSKNMQWLNAHFQSLNDIGKLEFKNADLWQLHQYFFSPVYSTTDEGDASSKEECEETVSEDGIPLPPSPTAPTVTPIVFESKQYHLGRAISFQTLGDAVAAATGDLNARGANKRLSEFDETSEDTERIAKRAKGFKPRIDYFPRLKVSYFSFRPFSPIVLYLTFNVLVFRKHSRLWEPSPTLIPYLCCVNLST